MQCLWILQEEAESYVRQKKYARALKRYHQMFKVSACGMSAGSGVVLTRYHLQLFTDIEEDQYDFHGYCVRKGTLRSYVQSVPSRSRVRAPTDSSCRFADFYDTWTPFVPILASSQPPKAQSLFTSLCTTILPLSVQLSQPQTRKKSASSWLRMKRNGG